MARKSLTPTYTWTELTSGGLLALLDVVTRTGGIERTLTCRDKEWKEVTESLRTARSSYGHMMFSSFGDRFNGADEIAVMKDGSIFVVATISSWGGTFASHDSISVKWYAGKESK